MSKLPASKTQERTKKWVCYYRVSTQRQGESGLGLEAQREAVERFLLPSPGEVIGEFTETESGRKVKNRPQFQAAIELCRRKRAVLVIAKLDRLARNLHAITSLMEAGIEFVAVDNPHANRLTIQILAAVAEHECRMISIRTSEALKAAKARGVVVGETGKALAQRHKAEAVERAEKLAPLIAEIRDEGHTTIRAIRDELNRREIPGPGGGKWHLPTTYRMLQRLGCYTRRRSIIHASHPELE